jgi:NAD(P)-dependent dehydrogenase (short-subunit alcohol dehydrogenase family)
VIVVSGGARGVTAACLVALAKAAQPRLVLLGRSRIDAEEPPAVAAAKDEAGIKKALFSLDRSLAPAELGRRAAAVLAAREARANLAAMAAAGSQATYVAVDVSDAAAVAMVLDEVRRSHGPITGFVHGAGVIQDKRVREKTEAQYTAVLSTKLDGLLALLDATASDPLRWIVLFSSVAARGGNVGQCDYALANEALNRVAAFEAATRPGCVVRSIGWGPWEGGMVTPALAKQFHAMGVPLLPIDAGAETFVRELAAGPGPTESIVGGEIAPPRERARALRIDASTAPRLVDHALAGSPVVPAVMAADALWRIAQDLRPRQRVAALRDLRVLKGIALRRWAAEGDVFELLAEVQGDERSIGVTLRTPEGPTHYHAVAELDGAASPPSAPPPLGDATAWPRSITTIYAENDLFHGSSFQALREVRVGDAGLDAVLADGAALGWDPQRGALDVPMFDGAVQLAALWTRHRGVERRLKLGGHLFLRTLAIPQRPGAQVGRLRPRL